MPTPLERLRRSLTPIGDAPCTAFTSISVATPSRRIRGVYGVPAQPELEVRLGVMALIPVEIHAHLFDDEDGSLIQQTVVDARADGALIRCRVVLPEELPPRVVLVIEGRLGDQRCGAELYVLNDPDLEPLRN